MVIRSDEYHGKRNSHALERERESNNETFGTCYKYRTNHDLHIFNMEDLQSIMPDITNVTYQEFVLLLNR